MSASPPGLIDPFFWASPTCRAGALHNHSASWVIVKPRALASVHIIGSRSCREEIAPEAFIKSPCSRSFIAGGHGEWSETTIYIAPAASICQSGARFSRLRIGGDHLDSDGS